MKTPQILTLTALILSLSSPSFSAAAPHRVMTLGEVAAPGSTISNSPCPELYNPVSDMTSFVNGWESGKIMEQNYTALSPVGFMELNRAGAARPEKISVTFMSAAGLDSLAFFPWVLTRSQGTDDMRPYTDDLGIEWRISGSTEKTLEPYWQGKKVIGITTVIMRHSPEDSITQIAVNPVTDTIRWQQSSNEVGRKYCDFMKARFDAPRKRIGKFFEIFSF